MLEIIKDKESSGYKFYVDESNGDLMITVDNIVIGSYSKYSGTWNFGGINMDTFVDGNVLLSQLSAHETKINQMEVILQNHYKALVELCEQHGMIDSDNTDGSNITPE
jgi:hypothetical protein